MRAVDWGRLRLEPFTDYQQASTQAFIDGTFLKTGWRLKDGQDVAAVVYDFDLKDEIERRIAVGRAAIPWHEATSR